LLKKPDHIQSEPLVFEEQQTESESTLQQSVATQNQGSGENRMSENFVLDDSQKLQTKICSKIEESKKSLKSQKSMNSPVDKFGLTFEQAKILFSCQYHLTLSDIYRETNLEKEALKRKWLSKWQESIEKFLQAQAQQEGLKDNKFNLLTPYILLEKEAKKMTRESESKLPLYLMLLEASLFRLYQPLGIQEDKQFKNLKLSNDFRNQIINEIELFAQTLELEREYVKRFKLSYEIFLDEIEDKGFNFNLLIGGLLGAALLAVAAALAVPVIVALLAPVLAPGLSGAAAISAVLAALGGGAIAAGGFGMTGGIAVIVGGGAILGATAGTGIGALFIESPAVALTQAAKFLVTFKDIILAQKDISAQEIASDAKELIRKHKSSIDALEEQALELNLDREKNNSKIENLKKVIKYFKRVLEISQGLLGEFLRNKGLL
jgi:hypothetical protein